MMTRGRSQWLWFALVVAWSSRAPLANRSPAQETPTPAAPAFDSSAKQAEKVDESEGFREAEPTSDSFGDSAMAPPTG